MQLTLFHQPYRGFMLDTSRNLFVLYITRHYAKLTRHFNQLRSFRYQADIGCNELGQGWYFLE